jgi:hypothetical protein
MEAETTIAVNPTNPLNIVAGAIATFSCSFYSSLDGGQTWTQGVLEIPFPGYTVLGDPALTFCNDGTAYYEVLATANNGGGNLTSNVFVYKSTDGGLTWDFLSAPGAIVTVSLEAYDKSWITCDTSGSSRDGTLYLEYSNAQRVACNTHPCRVIKIRRSTDHGATWSNEAIPGDNPQAWQDIASMAVGPNGELNLLYIDSDSENLLFDKSADGGATFGVDKFVYQFHQPFHDDPGLRWWGALPAIDVDRSNGPHRGNIYVVYVDGTPEQDPDILFQRSTDGGSTWSTPVRVNDDPMHDRADQWSPGMVVDSQGRVIVSFYDRRRYVGLETYERWGAISRDGGVTFDTNFLISDTPSVAPVQTWLGDYDSVAATSSYFYAVWADQRVYQAGESPDIYSDRYPNLFTYDEVRNVVWTGRNSLSFDAQDARFGQDVDYDVAGGLLGELRADQAYTHVGCIAALWPAPPFVDARVPPAGDGYYYLVRVHKGTGVGTYGDGYPFARPNIRDPLDETSITCP